LQASGALVADVFDPCRGVSCLNEGKCISVDENRDGIPDWRCTCTRYWIDLICSTPILTVLGLTPPSGATLFGGTNMTLYVHGYDPTAEVTIRLGGTTFVAVHTFPVSLGGNSSFTLIAGNRVPASHLFRVNFISPRFNTSGYQQLQLGVRNGLLVNQAVLAPRLLFIAPSTCVQPGRW
jgi:hypothetical protein